MSRSNPTQTNPAKRFFKWSGDDGKLVYYDKEKQQEVEVKLPFEFLVLDQLATMTGFSKKDKSSYWSNEVRSVAKEEFTVRTADGIKVTGLYKDLTDVRAKGAKYAKSIYVAYKDGDTFVIGNLKASGAALTAWIELSNKYVLDNGKVVLTAAVQAENGATTYFVPKFTWEPSETEEDEAAVSLDKELQAYLGTYLSARSNLFDRSESEEDWVPNEDELNATLNS